MTNTCRVLFFLTICFLSCGKSTQECAEESLIGNWEVTQVFQTKSEVVNGIPTTDSQSQSTFLVTNGKFVFEDNVMEYEFTTSSTMSLTQNYTLVTSKENAGFTRVNVFTVNGDSENFRVRFGDETNDAHENANEIALEQTITTDSSIIENYIELIRE